MLKEGNAAILSFILKNLTQSENTIFESWMREEIISDYNHYWSITVPSKNIHFTQSEKSPIQIDFTKRMADEMIHEVPGFRSTEMEEHDYEEVDFALDAFPQVLSMIQLLPSLSSFNSFFYYLY